MVGRIKKITRQISLKWVVFLFYLLFGFLPLVAVSLMTMITKSQTIEDITKEQMQISLTQIGLRMDMFYQEARDDLSGFARLIEVPCAIQEHEQNYKVRLESMILKFLSEHEQFDIIILFEPNSDVVAAADRDLLARKSFLDEEDSQLSEQDRNQILNRLMNIETRYLPLIVDINSLVMDDKKSKGYILAMIPIKKLAHIFQTARFGDKIERQIVDFTGQNLWRYRPLATPDLMENKTDFFGNPTYQSYMVDVESLGWKLIARIEDRVIFRDIYELLVRNISITLIVFILAACFVYDFGRKMTRQLKNILKGTREFAEGKLDHRVENVYGKELIALSGELNQMAQKLKKRQSSIIQTNKLESLGLFTAGIAHEIKNPLASIKTSSQVLKGFFIEHGYQPTVEFSNNEVEDIKTLSRGITDEVNRLNNLLKELLNFAKPGESNKQTVNVDSIIRKSLMFLKSDAKKEDIDINCNIEPFSAHIDGDHFTQIIMNIILNAKHALKGQKGLIQIYSDGAGIEKEEEGKTIIIQDNGPGIPEEIIDKVFDPFFSMSKSGPGLGLSIVYTLAQKNEIQVSIERVKDGGTKFILLFPDRIIYPGE